MISSPNLHRRSPFEIRKPSFDSASLGSLSVIPNEGNDIGAVMTQGKYLICSSDPITGAVDRIGWYAVNVSANDVATSGVTPQILSLVALFPEGTPTSEINRVMREVDETARGLNIQVGGRQTSLCSTVERTLLMVTAFGSGDEFVTSADAKPDDAILLTKTAGIEGTSILAKIPSIVEVVGREVCAEGAKLIDSLSVIKDAEIAFNTGKVHAMHDATEGGVLGSILEMSYASDLGFEVDADSVPLANSTRKICNKISIDPLKLIGSGSLIISCPKAASQGIKADLDSSSTRCTEIGKFVPKNKGRWVLRSNKKERFGADSIQDELWPTLSKYGHFS
jgi:hydrogenase expression/formation protein HypE